MKHLSQSGRFPSGNPRFYFRPKGLRGVALPDLPPHAPGWLAAYNAALAAHDGSQPSPTVRHAAITCSRSGRFFESTGVGTAMMK